MRNNDKRIGISGGTFDPVHFGHLIMAEQIREKFDLDKVLFIPTGNPPHKPVSRVTGAEHRFNMVELAVRSNPFFKSSRIEIEREGFTYTVDTLAELKRIYGDQSKLYFIIGADVVPELLTWKDYPRVFQLCEFIAAFRPGMKKQEFVGEIEHLVKTSSAVIHIAELPSIEISSTQIREKVKNQGSIRYLVPECVEEYIYRHKLYQE